MAEEIKQSWSPSFFTLTVVICLLTGGIGYVLKGIFDPAPVRILSVARSLSEDLLRWDQNVGGAVEATYRLKSDPQARIASFFRYDVAITNEGSEGAEAIQVFVEAENMGGLLIAGAPQVSTSPPGLRAADIVRPFGKTDSRRDNQLVSLLGPGEGVVLSYIAYSKERLQGMAQLDAFVRLKDWKVVEREDLDRQNRKGLSLADFTGSILPLTAAAIACIVAFVHTKKSNEKWKQLFHVSSSPDGHSQEK